MGSAAIVALIDGILTALGYAPEVLAGLKALLADVAGLFGSLGQDKAAAVTQQAVDITSTVETDAASALAWFNAEFPTIEALLAQYTGLPKLLYSASNIAADQNVTQHVALTSAQLGANSVKAAQTPSA